MAKKEKKVLASEPMSDDKWKAESDFRTLKEAEMIKQDNERLEKARKHGKSELKGMKHVITSTKQLRDLSNDMAMKDEDDDE